MVARNDITGDLIKSRDKLSPEGEENFDKIFGVKKKTNGGWVPPPLNNPQSAQELIDDWDESRVDTIGSNGNEGLHYDK